MLILLDSGLVISFALAFIDLMEHSFGYAKLSAWINIE